MNTISERALNAASKPTPRDPTDRERLREEWRLAAMAHVLADNTYQRAKEGKAIFHSELVGELMDANRGMKLTQAERMVTASPQYKEYVTTMHELRRRAAEAKIVAEDLDRKYWENVSLEANARAEMRMTGSSR